MKRSQADRIGAPGSLAELQRELAGALMPSSVEELQRQFAASLEQQAAIAQILEVINRSGGDLVPVYQAVLDAAQRLLLADSASMHRVVDAELESVAVGGGAHLAPGAAVGQRIEISVRTVAGTAALERRTIHVPDVSKEPHLPQNVPWSRLAVPVKSGDEVTGVIAVAHAEPRPFTPREIGLLETFAGQVGIAVENARLFNETRDALERQTATGEILRAMTGSPSSEAPVLDAIAHNAVRFCGAEDATVLIARSGHYRVVAHEGPLSVELGPSWPIDAMSVTGEAMLSGKLVHVADLEAVAEEFPTSHEFAMRTGHHRAMVSAPLLHDGRAIGAIQLRRSTPGPFAERQLDLLATFADQAVIAIENVRLFNETKEGLEQQTAISEILRVISSSPSELQPVLDVVVGASVRLTGAQTGAINLLEGDHLVAVVTHEAILTQVGQSIALDTMWPSARAFRERQTVHIADARLEFGPTAGPPLSRLYVPILASAGPLGVISLGRREMHPFAQREIELIETFAHQAAIAIENVRLFNETKEALERQTATAEILRVISSSPTEIQPVLDAIAENAARYCQAEDATVMLPDGPDLRAVAHFGPVSLVPDDPSPRSFSYPIDRGSLNGRAFLEGRALHTPDILSEAGEYPRGAEAMRRVGSRAGVAVPLLREGSAIGTINLRRREPRPFTEKQIELLRTFADQAVIAIENVRLFNETKEALERQTATAEILNVISASPTEIRPVFDAIAENALRFCGAEDAVVLLLRGDRLPSVAHAGNLSAEIDGDAGLPLTHDSVAGRAVLEMRTVHVPDLDAEPNNEYALARDRQRRYGFRSLLGTPLLREKHAIGAILLRRREAGPFTDRQIQLVSTFAAQAVIAIENVRLFNETNEALERQTAISKILEVISSSPTSSQPVLDAIAESAVRFCGAEDGLIWLTEGDGMARSVAHFGSVQRGATAGRARPIERGSIMGRTMLERRTVHVPDLVSAAQEYPTAAEFGREQGFAAAAGVPLIREGEVIGALGLRKQEKGAFTDRQLDLLETFARQAVIAIENVRLFNETKEALDQQTATAEILAVMSSSPTDVQPVLDAIARSATKFCAAEDCTLALIRDGILEQVAQHGPITGEVAPWPLDRGTLRGRAIMDRAVIQVLDMQAESETEYPLGVQRARELDMHTAVAAPLLREGRPLGAIALRRKEVRPFTEKQIALLRTFADQAAIAIENVRLFNETKEALEQQTATADVLKVISRSAFDLDAVFESLLQKAVAICNADWGSIQRAEGEGVRNVAQVGGSEAFREVNKRTTYLPGRDTTNGRALLEKRPVHVHDLAADPEYKFRASIELGGIRTNLVVPMVRDDKVIGTIGLSRNEVRPFTEKEIALVSTFADQAAIAIENVRLFNETKESLEQQTATAEILRVIAASPADIQPVLDAIAESAARFCSAEDTAFSLVDGDVTSIRAHYGQVELIPRERYPINAESVSGRALVERRTIAVDDLQAEAARYPLGSASSPTTRSILAVPVLRKDEPVGVIFLRRSEKRPFTGREIQLAEAFASQAAIAIENVRLFNETKEALERQTAISEILRVISESPTDIQPVLDAIAQNAARYCQAEDAVVMLPDSNVLRAVAHFGPHFLVPEDASPRSFTYPMDRGSLNGTSFLEGRVIHTSDIRAESDRYPVGAASMREIDIRAVLVAPLLREGTAIGTIALRRTEARPFTDKEIELLQTFAAQAVIAIENVRLFNETKESLDRQTAISNVMKAISGSVSESQRALDQVVGQATRLAGADNGFVYQVDGEYLRMTAALGDKAESMREWQRTHPIKTRDLGSATGRAFSEARTIHIEDVLADPTYTYHQAQELGGFRVLLAVPMVREGEPLGVLALWRVVPRPFSEAQIKIVELFADQAVVAVENARLFNETKDALGQQTAVRQILEATTRSAFDVVPVMQTIAERAAVLCEAEHAWVGRYTASRDILLDAYSGPSEDVRARIGSVRTLPGRASGPPSAAPAPIDEVAHREQWATSASPFSDEDAHKRVGSIRGTYHYATWNVEDALADPELSQSEIRALTGMRAWLHVPLVKEGLYVGAINLGRSKPGKFSDAQVGLIETFADQAVIAIENVRLFHEIQDKSRQLEVASRHKSEFLANMSHELRTPLNAIIGFTDVMLEEMFGPLNEKQKEYLEDVRNSGTHLLTLINDILDLSKVEAGRVELEAAEFSFPEALDNALTLVRERATRHGITLASEVAKDVGTVVADERKIKQILVNLLANAVKFTPDGGRVSVSARRANGEVEVAVHDTGIGVATEDQDRIFDEFQQVGRDPERSREGTGLGLTLTKRFVELHGGRIWVESEVGKGSTFTFAIPVRQTALADAKG